MNRKIFSSAAFIATIVLILIGCSVPSVPADGAGSRVANYYQCWTNGQGSASCSHNGNYFTANWSNIGDVVAGVGYNPCNSANLYWTGSCSGCAYFGVYGWLSSPLVEYYRQRRRIERRLVQHQQGLIHPAVVQLQWTEHHRQRQFPAVQLQRRRLKPDQHVRALQRVEKPRQTGEQPELLHGGGGGLERRQRQRDHQPGKRHKQFLKQFFKQLFLELVEQLFQ